MCNLLFSLGRRGFGTESPISAHAEDQVDRGERDRYRWKSLLHFRVHGSGSKFHKTCTWHNYHSKWQVLHVGDWCKREEMGQDEG
uniref:Uncharacterized protein n=1 Tax=Aegilops tauschii subsp. strangulata TaxID=200361 RepID=A0A453GY65_AEGTS